MKLLQIYNVPYKTSSHIIKFYEFNKLAISLYRFVKTPTT